MTGEARTILMEVMEMLTVDALQEFGADTAEGLARCMNNEQFYLRLVAMAVGDANFEKLADAIGAQDFKAAFEAAHALKGLVGNLSLTPLFTIASEMTELLRAETEADYAPMCDELLGLRQQLQALIDG